MKLLTPLTPMKTEWISVEQKLPRQGKEVLIFWKNHQNEKFIVIGQLWKDMRHNDYNRDQWHFTYYDVGGAEMLDDSQVTHWMELPKRPKK